MKNIISALIILILVYGCSKSTTTEQKPLNTLEILHNGILQETFIITEENDGDIYPIYFEEQQIGEIEIDIYPIIIPPDEETIIFLVLSRKDDNYTIFNQSPFDMLNMSPFDTLRIDYQLDFEPYMRTLIVEHFMINVGVAFTI